MLTIVLCSFRVPVGKYFLRITQHYSPRFLNRECLASIPARVAEILITAWCYRLKSREKFINLMLQGSGYEITPALEMESALNFFCKESKSRIISLSENKVASGNRFQTNKALTQIATKLGGIA